MTEVPKIVHDRLRAALPPQAAPGQPHPDEDLLAAFAEQALLPKERDCVLEHLAKCGDCREVLALAMPATEIAAAVAHETEETGGVAGSARAVDKSTLTSTKPGWAKLLALPRLRWAALAVCVVVVASVLVLHPGKVRQPLPPQASRQTEDASASGTLTAATSVPPPSISSSPVASSHITSTPVASSPVTSSPMTSRSAARAANPAKPDKARPESQTELASTLKAQQLAPAESDSLLARNEAPRVETSPIEKAKPALSVAEGQNNNGAQNSEQNSEVSAGENTQQTTDSAVVPGAIAMRSNAVSGAKMATAAPAPGLTLAPHISTPQNVSWTIAAGLLQRSLDSGQNWQTALRADHPLLCYASLDDEVWAGGQAGTLFHSTDNGVSWVQVQPSITQTSGMQLSRAIERLSSDVTYIDFRSSKEIALTTADHAVWRSADGGKTWEVK
jgi:hypothetical protein